MATNGGNKVSSFLSVIWLIEIDHSFHGPELSAQAMLHYFS